VERAVHVFILDTLVSGHARRQGIGTRMVSLATDHSRAAGCEWLHVDFDDELGAFYYDSCGFTPARAGVIAL
jgi:ribosomal protein S18 acetylase RimI-like enzyme